MRHPSSIKKQVRELRSKGYSLNQIYDETNIPKTTIRLWIRDILLSKEQREILQNRTQRALQRGRIHAQALKKRMKEVREENHFHKGLGDIKRLSQRELLVAGIALYWGEGFKNGHEHRLGFCNSDPDMMQFYILWLERSLGITKNDLIARLTLNSSYKVKTKEIEEYWANITKIPLSQFTKPFYQHSQWKKQYKTDKYHGVLRIHVKNSLDYLWQMRGWIEGMKHVKISNTDLPG
ncbi:MAG TPA: hypothetical protein VN711_01385 [Candidatus Saccharimonadales bacterium]|nr:hypothetical protein [Candidatus Saccharimonadales bacterium]